VYPYHHRKYLFVSLGGYWPVHYRYIRYYWYPSHAYDWYGYQPIAHEVQGDTYNYYTYNYYYDDTISPAYPTQTTQPLTTVDENTFADVREKLAAQAESPDAQTSADTYFEEAVKAFENSDYDTAADKFAEAMGLAPDDMVLPFAYVQALFADKKYLLAAEALRQALAMVPTDQEGVFYPRGLYPEEDILFEQIDKLAEAVPLRGFDPDLQLLLGYQLLGSGSIADAAEPLQQAGLNSTNAASAKTLLDLLEKINTETSENVEQ
jgi:tetratricopeptide (TPR) repeat protein